MSEWIENTGECPVAQGTLIDVQYRDGDIEEAIPALERPAGRSWATDWEIDGSFADIMRWRLSECRSSYCECPVGECSGGRVDMREDEALLKAAEAARNEGYATDEEVQALVGTIPNVNPKEAIGSTKIPMHLASPLATAYMALGLANGAMKYGTANFKATPVLASIYLDGAKRHINAWLEGEEYDPDDGVPNLAGGLANLAIIIEARANGTLIDDRPIGDGWIKERDHLTEIYRNLKKLHEGKQPHHFTRNNA